MSVTYRAPSRDGEALILPGLNRAAAQIAENRRRQREWRVELCGHDLAHWRQAARHAALRDAIRYTRAYRDVVLADEVDGSQQTAFVMAGHQPTLFHPGVWFKNFAIGAIQRRIAEAGGPARASVAINLVIDNDVATSSSIRVPLWDRQRGQLSRSTVAYDSAAGGVPFEQNRIRDRAVFDGFAESVQAVVSPLIPEPLVVQLWPHAIAAAQRCENVSCALAQARHVLEGQQGLQTLELPLSVLCRGESFAAFVLALISDPQRLRTIYNETADQYRSLHGIRSSAHPVPNLGVDGEWTEVPLWIYGDDAPQRRGAWVRRSGGTLEISDRQLYSVEITHCSTTAAAAAELADRCGPQFKLRPRALLTTMYTRLVLSDLFVHGIGGAKYDELGDEVTRRFFGIEPPELMVVSATCLLPVPKGIVPDDVPSLAALRQQIRQTYFAPELFAGVVDLPAELRQAKHELILNRPDHGSRKQWHNELTRITAELSKCLESVRESLTEQMPAARQAESAAAILSNREHPFCLFPLQPLMQTFEKNLDHAVFA
jgi:hypothetical protein